MNQPKGSNKCPEQIKNCFNFIFLSIDFFSTAANHKPMNEPTDSDWIGSILTLSVAILLTSITNAFLLLEQVIKTAWDSFTNEQDIKTVACSQLTKSNFKALIPIMFLLPVIFVGLPSTSNFATIFKCYALTYAIITANFVVLEIFQIKPKKKRQVQTVKSFKKAEYLN